MSYPFASRYVDQFPKDKTVQLSRFIAFITGALAAVLAVSSVVDPELFLGFEITPERTVLFYLGVFGTVWAVARGAVPEETLVFDPEYALNDVVEYTRYLPASWRGRLHSNEVRKEFTVLYQMKLVIFLEELLSIIFTPFVLWFSLPKCSDRVVDFFREFTVHVDGLGYVCSFAVFDFKKGGNDEAHPATVEVERQGVRDDYHTTKDGKMLASYFGFLDNYTTNPRLGGPRMHGPGKRHFPPPSFHGMIPPPMETEPSGRSRLRTVEPFDQSLIRPIGGSIAGMRSMNAPARFPKTQPMSPMPSVLLDPHHQPTGGGSRRRVSTRAGPSTKVAMPRHQLADDPLEDNEDSILQSQQPMAGAGSSGSGGLGDDSHLGESWRTTQATNRDGDEENEEDVDAATGDNGADVLGLLYQFQKAQTEGRGAGVNI
jgi:autophagy-related protein 9